MLQPTRLISTPFAQEGEKTEIQNVTGEFDNSATYRLGFPPLTMQSIRLGGKPPKGTDFNGVLFDITENISFLCKGGRYQYNAGLSTLIGGYPEGSNLLLDDNVTEVVSTVAGNQNNPNINMTGWVLKPNKTTAVNVADASGETQQQVNYNGGSKWHSRVGGYLENERVVLANGDIVKSTVDGNVNDPNVDMGGWVNTNASSQISYTTPVSNLYRELQSKSSDILSLKDFGAVGDGVVDDTLAVQRFVDYICTKHTHGYAPAGTYKLTAKINFRGVYGWGIIGSGAEATIFKQFTDNIPCFDLGSPVAEGMHSYTLRDFKLTYNTKQGNTNTNANPIVFSQMGYEGVFDSITFGAGHYAIKVKSGVGCPWGQTWDNLIFGGQLTGGAMDWTGGVNAVPNNSFGRFLVTATSMTDTIFKNIRGYNWVWGALELLSGTNVQWISLQAGSVLGLSAIKMEMCDYSGSPTWDGLSLIYAPNCQVDIGQLDLGGTVCRFEFTSARNLCTVSAGSLSIQSLATKMTALPTNFYLFSASGGDSYIRYRQKGTYPVDYSNVGSSDAANFLTVYPDKNDKLSVNKGDADYTISLGDHSMIQFETALTAQRTVNLPTSNSCFNGLRYRIYSRGAVNGSNNIAIKAGGVTKHTLTTDKTFVDFEWRRNATPHNGWVIVNSGILP